VDQINNRNLQTSRAPLESQAQDTRLLAIAASNHRGCPEDIPCCSGLVSRGGIVVSKASDV